MQETPTGAEIDITSYATIRSAYENVSNFFFFFNQATRLVWFPAWSLAHELKQT